MPTVRKTQAVPSEAAASPKTVTAPKRRQVSPQEQTQAQHVHRRPTVRGRTRPAPAEGKESAPFLLKLLSWLGIILLCFVIGYIGTSWFMEFLNKKLLLKPENRIENQEDLGDFQEAETDREAARLLSTGGDIQQVSLNLYHVRNDTIAETRKNFVSRTREDNIRDAVEEILNLSEVPNVNRIKLLHVFRSDDTAFLDMTGQFASSIEAMGERKSLLLLTGFVRTLQENFSPVTQIRFLIDSKAPKSGGDVNLAAPWKMPKKADA